MLTILLSKLRLILIFCLITFGLNAQESDYNSWKINYDKGVELKKVDSLKKALTYFEKSLEIAKINKIDSTLIKSLSELGTMYKAFGDFDKAENTIQKTLRLIENSLGKTTDEYSSNLLELSIIYKRKSDYKKAVQSAELSNEIIKEIYGTNSLEYNSNLSNLSQVYVEISEYDKAISIQKNVLQYFEGKDKTSNDYAFACFTMSYLNHYINEYEVEIEFMEKAIAIYGDKHSHYPVFIGNIGLAYQSLGNYEQALHYLSNAVKYTKNKKDKGFAMRLEKLAFNYVSLGEYNKAHSYYNKALDIWNEYLNKNHEDYGQLLNNIGKLYRQTGEFEKAKQLFKEALDNFLQNFNKNHSRYGYILNDYASMLLELGQEDEAIVLMKENLQIAIDNNAINTEDFYGRQYSLAKAYNRAKKYNEAIPLLESATKNIPKIIGTDHPKYGQMLKSLSDTHIGLGNIDKAVLLIKSSNEIQINQIDQIFKFRSEKEKQSFLKTLSKNFDDLQSLPLTNVGDFNNLNSINLNNQLMLKGLLLNNSKNILSQLSTLNDAEIETMVVNFKTNKRLIAKVLTQAISDREIDVDSLKNIINTEEASLVKLYSDNFKDNVSLVKDWKQPQTVLKKKEVAIEFSNFRLSNNNKITDTIMYVAYVYKKDWEYPKMISLFEERKLKTILAKQSSNELYKSNKLYNLLWKPLESYITNSNTVYYSPSGLLNQISFSALQNDKKTLNSQYDLVQLSSTDILAQGKTEPSLTSTLFIGGINYDYTETINLAIDTTQYAYFNTKKLMQLRGTKSRGESFDDLPGTLIEIENLQSVLKSKGIDYSILKGKEATEANFKKLSGNSPNILHIATHGFFFENRDQKPKYNMNLSTEDQYRFAEDPLVRSGLILAGANYAWKHGSNPNEEEDGILTALEISNMDLSNTDIVVLSACETGLGDIDGSEGVYGLQRAFKMAGVDIIVMSLWQVEDEETAEFMNLFYSYWMKNKNVRKAFNKAQQKMQNKYKNEPLKWAAFVMFE